MHDAPIWYAATDICLFLDGFYLCLCKKLLLVTKIRDKIMVVTDLEIFSLT